MTDSYYEPHAQSTHYNAPNSAHSDGSFPPNVQESYDPSSHAFGAGGQMQYTNGATAPASGAGGAGTPNPVVRKKLASWVGFSNLPNQVHRRSVR